VMKVTDNTAELAELIALHLKGGGRITLTRAEAAASLGISTDSFDKHVAPELPMIRRGKIRLIRPDDLDRWAKDNAVDVFGRSMR
jgi:hypothetical protein